MEEEIIFNNIKLYNIKDLESYYVSKCGRVYSNKLKGRVMKEIKSTKGV